jgi:hypothetical protein
MDKEGGLRNSVRAVAGSGLAIWMLCEGSEARRRRRKQDYGGGEMFIQRQGWFLPELRKGASGKAVRGVTNILALCRINHRTSWPGSGRRSAPCTFMLPCEAVLAIGICLLSKLTFAAACWDAPHHLSEKPLFGHVPRRNSSGRSVSELA